MFAQTYQNWDWFIIDDQSKDSSAQILHELAKDSRVHIIINECNLGAALSRNRGIEAASGRYIAFLDSDDLWHTEKLEQQIAFMQKHDFAFTYHGYDKIVNDIILPSKHSIPIQVDYNGLLKSNVIGCLTVIYDTNRLGKIFMQNEHGTREDYVCWLQILKKTKYAHGLDATLAYYRILPGSVSFNKRKMAIAQWHVYTSHEKIPFLKSLYYFLNYVWHGFWKYR